MMLFFDVQLSTRVGLNMESMILIDEHHALPGASLHINGDFMIDQVNPLYVRTRRTTYNTAIIEPGNVTSIQDIAPPVILQEYFKRNETTSLHAPYSYWTSGSGDNEFFCSVLIRVPTQDILYIPEAFETLKFALVQYLAIWFVIYVIFRGAMRFVFDKRIVHTRVQSEASNKLHPF
jgi:Transmembrane protein 231